MVSAAGFNVAIHIGERFKVDKDAGMRRFLLRVTVGCAALVVGVLIGSIHQRLLHNGQSANVAQAVPTSLPAPPTEGAALPIADESYPEDKGVTSWDIEYFIDQNPNANLTRLFERLNVRGYGVYPIGSTSYWQCTHCKAQSFEYNLDDDPDGEIVLSIGNRMLESYRYLIFKRAYNETKLLGHIDARGKYRPSTHTVLLSGGKQWLLVESQAANGSGLSAYLHTIYQVTPNGVKPAISYLSEINQFGFSGLPTKTITAQPISCEIEAGRMKATVSYTVEYSLDAETSLFTKQQTAVLTATVGRDSTRLDTNASNITNHEFETVFNFDSMGDDEFLNYNRSELRAIAAGRDATKKKWLKEDLENCESSRGVKRELLSLLLYCRWVHAAGPRVAPLRISDALSSGD